MVAIKQQIPSLFGTDGIRGKANLAPMDAQTTLRIAMAAAHVMKNGRHRHRVIIGKDTRLSGYMIENAMSAGFTAMGMEVILVGPLPTPAIAMLTHSMRCDIGVVISASHNPFDDNGIKLFSSSGCKINNQTQQQIEQTLHENSFQAVASIDVGTAYRLDDARGRYIEYIKSHMPKKLNLSGMKIVIDCANGASYKVAPQVLWELEAEVVSIAVSPDGKNINHQCGATDTSQLQDRVRREKADIGIALDGDGDRVILTDERGEKIDGDLILAALATYKKEQGQLKSPYAVVGTSMSNVALKNYLASQNMKFLCSDVGDRQVARMMRDHNASLGGESSGHIILGDHNDVMSGDGLRAALEILAIIKQEGKKASQILHPFTALPAIERNVACNNKNILEQQSIRQEVRKAQISLREQGGQLVVRPSGTEPCIRITAQSDNRNFAEKIVKQLASMIEQKSSVSIPA